MIKKILLTVFFVIVVLPVFSHPFHVCVTNIDYVTEKNRFTVSFKFYAHDLAHAMEHRYNKTISFDKEGKSQQIPEIVSDYLNYHFNMKLNGDTLRINDMKFSYKEKKGKSLWIYYTFTYNKSVDSVSISNTLMNDMNFDQKNLVFFIYKDIEKSYKFNRDNTEGQFKL